MKLINGLPSKEYHRQWYERTKHLNLPKKMLNVANYRKRKKKEFFAIMESRMKCEQCGESHPACLDFHHVNPAEKDLAVSTLLRFSSLKRAIAEAEKCQVLCANCHRKLHAE